MATAEEGFMKKLAVYATLAVLAHAVIVVWPSVGAGEDSAWTHRSTGSVGGYRDQWSCLWDWSCAGVDNTGASGYGLS